MPAVTLAGLFCGAAVLVATRPDVVPPLRPPARIALAVLALAFTALTATFVQTEGALPFG
jgi:hypothetical protein